MESVTFYVYNIIQQIDCTGRQTKQHKGDDDPEQCIEMGDLAVKQNRQENQTVFRPLARAHPSDQTAQPGWEQHPKSRSASHQAFQVFILSPLPIILTLLPYPF